jgi:hypothetical protein
LKFGNIAFNAPSPLRIDDSAEIQLVLSLSKPIDELKQSIEAAGERRGARIQVSDRMEAHLAGPNFSISAITPEDEAVTQGTDTKWEWEVSPKSEGTQHLHLTLSALLLVDGQSTPRSIRTFDADIRVYVPVRNQILAFIDNHLEWLWTTLLIPAYILLRRVMNKQSKSADHKSDGT